MIRMQPYTLQCQGSMGSLQRPGKKSGQSDFRGRRDSHGWNGQRLVEEQLAKWTVGGIRVAILSLPIMKQITVFQGVAVGRYEGEEGGEREDNLVSMRDFASLSAPLSLR